MACYLKFKLHMKARTVLIVDDDKDDLEFFCDAVQEVDENTQCIAVDGSLEALELLRQENSIVPDFIFMDINMPRMNGKQCLLEIKKLPQFTNTHFILYSTTRLTDEIRAAQKMGVHFINKPNSYSALRTIIDQVFKESWPDVDLLMQ